MKKKTLPQGTIRVDEIKDKGFSGYYYLNGEIFNTATTMLQSGCKKIIASEFFIDKDLPMYVEEDDVEKLAENTQSTFYQEMLQDLGGHSKATHKANFNNAENPIYGYIKGYKAAQQKGCYTEDDLKKAFCFGTNEGYAYRQLEEAAEDLTNVEKGEDERLSKFIQSLKNTPVEFEMDFICCIGNPHIDTCGLCADGKEIIKTTRDADGQLWCKLKKQKLWG